jgi:SAM-dependent methyltransferase
MTSSLNNVSPDRLAGNPRDYYEGYWEHGIDAWSPTNISITPFEEKLLRPFISSSCDALDYGCGDGAHAGAYLAARCRSYQGIDVSRAAVAAASERGLRAQVFDSEAPLPFPGAAFDLIVCFEVLEHTFAPAEIVQEQRRVLRPGGHLAGSVPNITHLSNRLLLLLGHFNPGGSPSTSLKKPWSDPHIRFFSKRTLAAMLRQAGFRRVRVTGSPFSFEEFPVAYRSPRAVRSVLRGASVPAAWLGRAWPSLFSSRLYFVAEK